MLSNHVLRHRFFAVFWASRFLRTIARLIVTVSMGWQVYTVARQTNSIQQSAFLVGMIGFAQFLPLFLLALIGGETADRYERRKILFACTVLQFACTFGLMLQARSSHPSLTMIFVTAACFGVATAFGMPAGTALGPRLVPQKELPQAVAWNTLATQGGMVLGPWLGGLLCALSPFWAYGFASGLYVLCGLLVASLMLMKLERQAQRRDASRFAMIREGLHYLWHNKIVFGAISLDLVAVFLGGATALLPVYARDILHIGASGFGILRSGPALGGGLMTLWISVRPVKRRAGACMLWAVTIFGVATIAFGLARNLWLSVAMLAILGAADSISVYVRQSLVQVVTPDPMRGRVAAVSSLFIGASNEFGEFESGVAARLIGPVAAVIFGGGGSIFVTGLWAWMFPALRKADKLEPPEL